MFNIENLEINRTIIYKGIEYRVADESGSGLLLVCREDDIKNKRYPI